MKQSEAKRIFIELTNERLESLGFKLIKTRDINAIFIREKENGNERIGVSTTNYYPEVVFEMGTQKRINEIEEILWSISEQYRLDLNLEKGESTTFSYRGFHHNERRLKLLEVENKDNELGVMESTKILMDFIENELLPAYDLFDDLRELDKRVNGEGENFWESDSGNFRPFSFPHFYLKRLIIGRLCKSEKGFVELTDKIYKMIDKNCEELKLPPFDRNDTSIEINMAINYLKENVSPIY